MLLTTRFPEMVGPEKSVVMDTLMPAEAEDVLRRAAELPTGERLCDAAMKVLDICGRVAMDAAFVGSWICQVENKRKEDAWARAVEKIKAKGVGVVGLERDVNRLAILCAGFEYLGAESVVAKKLYVELAIFPDGHAFDTSDAAVLLGDGEVATKPISILERWGVLGADSSDKYRMHDAHVDFAREKLRRWEDVREPAVERWTKHISRLDFAVGVDRNTLLVIWQAVKKVGGDGWWVTRPYDDQLVQMEASDPSTIDAVHAVAYLHFSDKKVSELERIMRKVLGHCDVHGVNSVDVQRAAVYYIWCSIGGQGRSQEEEDLTRRLGELCGPGSQIPKLPGGTSLVRASKTLRIYGAGVEAAGRRKEAEEWYRKLLKNQEAEVGDDDLELARTQCDLGVCLRQAGNYGEAEALLKRALEIREDNSGPDHSDVAWALTYLGECVWKAGRPGDAVPLLRRVLEIKEAKLGPDDLVVADMRSVLARCVEEGGGPVATE